MAPVRAVVFTATAAAAAAANVQWRVQPSPYSGVEAVYTDVSLLLSTAQPGRVIGYASAEEGRLIKLNASLGDSAAAWVALPGDGERDWDYPYGVHAFADEATVLVTGFEDNATDQRGFVQFSRTAGATWEAPVDVSAQDQWLGGPINQVDAEHLMAPSTSGSLVWHSSTGGRTAADWQAVDTDPSGAWFSGPFIFNASGYARLAGSSDCISTDYGATWACQAAVDSVFDGGIACDAAHAYCIVGGGQISVPLQGWVHLSRDDGRSWQQRALTAPWPVRVVLAIDRPGQAQPLLIAAGGNFFSGVGGAFSSVDGGKSWSRDLSITEEVKACRALQLPQGAVPGSSAVARVWCVSGGQNSGNVYVADV